MNLCVLKHSHKAQILEHDESLSEDSCFFSPACTRCPDRGCGLCEDPAVLLASRASLLVDGMAVPSVLTTDRPSRLWQVTVPARRAWEVSGLCDAVLVLPKPASPKGVSVQGSPDASNSCWHCQGCPHPVWPRFQAPSVCLWKTTWTQSKGYSSL